MATKGQDDLESVRLIASTLQAFDDSDRERILRWVRERLGMKGAGAAPSPADLRQAAPPTATSAGVRDIRTFIQDKKPSNERHLAAVVAYFHQLEAPTDQRKDSIGSQDLTDACRVANWARPKNPAQTLINAFKAGYIDKAGERGKYRLNAVGENLVAMVLPEGTGSTPVVTRGSRPGRNKKRKINKRR